ncbi:hypothetical protein [Planotetraspora mira]|uniref:Uncharacterized protein n=1 Tax=Planotetraspora mira TaxID=58121 RepID=A0A8J3TLQ9_9ACTN|nr:hypothetical protein [Planotetraspora mira]GII27477.1 hypothetical protein Pmi06nite_09190 [Planotetraspora mira]
MRRFALAVAITALVTGCSSPSTRDSATSATSAPASAPGAARTTAAVPVELPQLADLTEFADGKTLLRHVDDKAELAGWGGKFTARRSYHVIVDCVGAVGDVTTEVSDGTRSTERCSNGANSFRNETLSTTAKAFRVKVKVPPGARWAILVFQPS